MARLEQSARVHRNVHGFITNHGMARQSDVSRHAMGAACLTVLRSALSYSTSTETCQEEGSSPRTGGNRRKRLRDRSKESPSVLFVTTRPPDSLSRCVLQPAVRCCWGANGQPSSTDWSTCSHGSAELRSWHCSSISAPCRTTSLRASDDAGTGRRIRQVAVGDKDIFSRSIPAPGIVTARDALISAMVERSAILVSGVPR